MMFFIWLIVGFLLIALGLFIFTQGGQNLGPAIATIGVVILLVLLVSPARSEDGHTHSGKVGQFYQTWTMPDNRAVSCCHDQDCTAAEAKFENGRWLARRAGEQGEFTPVPRSKIEQERDSPDGRNHICGRGSGFGEFTVFCFLPSSGG